jgi:hypothetical protein
MNFPVNSTRKKVSGKNKKSNPFITGKFSSGISCGIYKQYAMSKFSL